MNYENFDTMRGMPRWVWVVEVHSASQTYVKGRCNRPRLENLFFNSQ